MISIDPASPTPPYEQIRAQVAEQVSDGRLVTGTKLPTVRQLADDLGLAPNTVARAYRELEAAGLVETRGRAGTTVSAAGDRSRETVRRAAEQFAEVVRAVGVPMDEARRMVEAALAR